MHYLFKEICKGAVCTLFLFNDLAAREGVPFNLAAILPPNEAKASPAAKSEAQPESFESYQIRILRNQNSLQTEKIKSLKEELLEVSRQLHEIKPQLFVQTSGADQAKIADLTLQLGQYKQDIDELHTKRVKLEAEQFEAGKKKRELETVKNALATFIEK